MTDFGEYALGGCFRCDRVIQVTHVGEIVSADAETPLYACRACAERLATMHAPAHDSPIRTYVQRAHPH